MRKINSVKNFISSVIPFFIIAILGFVKIDVFISTLGIEIYAINQLFFQLFSCLTLLEAGIGVLITQRYYKHLIDVNYEKINNIYTFSVKFLRKISIYIIIIGIVISFLLKFLTNNNLSLGYMQVVFILFIIKNVVDYLMFSPRFVLQADQKIYKINLKVNFAKITESCFEIILLLVGYNYFTILLVGIIIRIIFNYFINKRIFNEYKWLKKVSDSEIEPVTGLKSVFTHKITGAVYNNTDIIIISAVLDPIKVVIYASYNYIIKFITDFVYMISNAITASYGNVAYKENKKDQYTIFEEINSLFLFCAMYFSTAIYVVTHKFIALWIGPDKIMNDLAFILMILVMFYTIARKPFIIMRDSVDLFKVTQFVSIIEAIINLILSIILIHYFSLPGILFATLISSLITTYWFYPNYVYNKIYGKTSLIYHLKYVVSIGISLIIGFISVKVLDMSTINGYLMWFLVSSSYAIILFIIMFIINYVISLYYRRLVGKSILLMKDVFLKNATKNINK